MDNATALPMMGFDYGFLPDAGDAVKAKVSFGPLECTGQKELGPPGTSCASLRLIYGCFGNDFVKAFLYCFFSRSIIEVNQSLGIIQY